MSGFTETSSFDDYCETTGQNEMDAANDLGLNLDEIYDAPSTNNEDDD